MLEVVADLFEAWYTTSLDIEEVLSGVVESDVHLDVVKSFDTVDRGVLDLVLSSLELPGWFRHAYFDFHSHVRLRFKLATGLGQPWTRDGSIPVSRDPGVLVRAARFTTWYVRLVGQEPAPGKCVLMSTSRAVSLCYARLGCF